MEEKIYVDVGKRKEIKVEGVEPPRVMVQMLGIGGGGGTSDYNALQNKPSINGVELAGEKGLAELGIQPEIEPGTYDTYGAAAGVQANLDTHTGNANVHVTTAKKAEWDAKADAGDIPTALSDLTDDATHRTVTDTEKATWNAKADAGDISTALAEYRPAAEQDTIDAGFLEVAPDMPQTVKTNNAVPISVKNNISAQHKAYVGFSTNVDGGIGYIGINNGEPVFLAADGVTEDVLAKTGDIPTALSDLTDDTTHRTVTDTEKAAWNAAASGGVASVNGKTGAVVLGLSDLTDDATHRTVTDTEKAAWNAKQDAIPANTYDTYGAAAGVQSNLDTHTGNSDIHVTAAKKATWDAKADAGDIPAVISELTNDAGYQTSAEVSAAITAALTTFFDVVHPVGSIYMTTDSRNPGIYLGGTWTAWGSGRVPVGVDTGNTYFNTVEKTGGHQNMQAHSHVVKYQGSANRGSDNTIYGDFGGTPIATTANFMVSAASSGAGTLYRASLPSGSPMVAATTGTGDSNNLQPYITCYMWKRTA